MPESCIGHQNLMVFDFHFTKFVGKNKDVIDGVFVDGQRL